MLHPTCFFCKVHECFSFGTDTAGCTKALSSQILVFFQRGQNNFGLYKTLKTHMKLSHNMAAPVKALVSVTPKQKPRSAVSRASSIPARARPTNTSRWERNAGLGKLQESEKTRETRPKALQMDAGCPYKQTLLIVFLLLGTLTTFDAR